MIAAPFNLLMERSSVKKNKLTFIYVYFSELRRSDKANQRGAGPPEVQPGVAADIPGGLPGDLTAAKAHVARS